MKSPRAQRAPAEGRRPQAPKPRNAEGDRRGQVERAADAERDEQQRDRDQGDEIRNDVVARDAVPALDRQDLEAGAAVVLATEGGDCQEMRDLPEEEHAEDQMQNPWILNYEYPECLMAGIVS